MGKYLLAADEQSCRSISDSFTITYLTQKSASDADNTHMQALV